MADLVEDVHRDVWVEILSRLPVKDLLRIKAVCRKWRSLISDAEFVEAQCRRSNERHSLLFHEDYRALIQYSSEAHITNEHAEIATSPYWSKDLDTEICKILGSCDGLLLVSYHNEFLLWNPATRQRRRIQCSAEHARLRWRRISGIGRNSRNGNYKAVLTFKYEKSCQVPWLYEGFVTYVICFNTGRCLKSKADTCPYKLPHDMDRTSRGVIVNGDPHWGLARSCSGSSDGLRSYAIVYFDMRDDKFKELPQHHSWAMHVGLKKLELGVSQGQLCAFYRLKNGITKVWAMKDYGVGDSWVQLFVVKDSWKAVCFTCNNDILLEPSNYNVHELEGSVFLHNFERGTTTNVTSFSAFDCQCHSPHPYHYTLHEGVSAYAESLVWIDAPLNHHTHSHAQFRRSKGAVEENVGSGFFLKTR